VNVHHRTRLAIDIADRLLAFSLTSASASGLFLAAPRRTGKSTFLREDLRPVLEQRGAVVIYADLWADRGADPGDVIVAAIRQAMGRRDGVIARLARSTGMDKVQVGGLSFSVDKVGLAQGVPLSAA